MSLVFRVKVHPSTRHPFTKPFVQYKATESHMVCLPNPSDPVPGDLYTRPRAPYRWGMSLFSQYIRLGFSIALHWSSLSESSIVESCVQFGLARTVVILPIMAQSRKTSPSKEARSIFNIPSSNRYRFSPSSGATCYIQGVLSHVKHWLWQSACVWFQRERERAL